MLASLLELGNNEILQQLALVQLHIQASDDAIVAEIGFCGFHIPFGRTVLIPQQLESQLRLSQHIQASRPICAET